VIGTPQSEPWRVLQVDREACPEVVDAAFRVLREQACADDGPDAPRRLAELTRAHRALRGPATAGG
jgi:hypothetical protein